MRSARRLEVDAIRRVGEQHVCLAAVHQHVHRIDAGAVSTHHAVLAHYPHVACLGHGLLGRLRSCVWIGQAGLGAQLVCADQIVQILGLKPQQRQVELHVAQLVELDGQHVGVPARIQREAVVRDHVGAALRVGQARQGDRGDRG